MSFHWLSNLRARWISGRQAAPNRRRRTNGRAFAAAQIELLEDRALLAAAFTQFVDPNPAPGNQFGATITPLSTGNVVVTSPFDDAGGTDAGAVYLFDGATGELISTITGSHTNDQVGSDGITALTNGNFVIDSSLWNDGTSTRVGAVTWASGTAGVSGVVSALNSLVGAQTYDSVGNAGITALTNGNYVVASPYWAKGNVIEVGAVTWADGETGISGQVSPANSLVGNVANDGVGGHLFIIDPTTYLQTRPSGVTALPNGNFVVVSPYLDLGVPTKAGYQQDVGAVTWGNGTTGITGTIDPTNSLMSSTAFDGVGFNGVVVLSNSNYVVSSPNWTNGDVKYAGAVTWADGATGVSGMISATNSLVGTSTMDTVGGAGIADVFSAFNTVMALKNGNYVVRTRNWDDGTKEDVGAVTFVDGLTGIVGEISVTNSLIGSHAGDTVGNRPITELTNGNYVVNSPVWSTDTTAAVGAVTLGNGVTGIVGVVSDSNSLVGSTANDRIGVDGITPLVNGNYVVCSSQWHNGNVEMAGAVTLGNGVTGTYGVVGAGNSLVGSRADDRVGYENLITPLQSGNYVVDSYFWSNLAGAVTWGNGTTGVVGVVSADNSLIGRADDDPTVMRNDLVGYLGVVQLANGNYVVCSSVWSDGPAQNRVGAVTWGSGTSGVRGLISSTNSLIGSTQDDHLTIGIQTGPQYYPLGLYPLENGNYLIVSPNWDNGSIVDAGAVTWANGTTGITGFITADNSLVGTSAGDKIGSRGITLLDDGNYVVASPLWDNGSVVDVGAVTWGDAATGVHGAVSATNSLVGTTTNDQVGSSGVVPLPNGNYSIISPYWDSSTWVPPVIEGNASLARQSQTTSTNTLVDAGAVTFGTGSKGVRGAITSTNSAIGTTAASGLKSIVLDNVNHTFFSQFTTSKGGVVSVGSQTTGFANVAPTAVVLTNRVTSLPDNTSTASHVKIANVKIVDDALGTNVLSLSGTDAASFELVGGVLYLKAGVALNGLTKTSYSVTVNVKDTTLGNAINASAQFTLSVTHAKRPPVIGHFTGPVFFTENGQPLPLDSAVTITDPDVANFNGGTLTVAITVLGEASDRLQIRNQGVLAGQIGIKGSTITFGGTAIGTVTGGQGTTPLVVTLNSNATPAATQALLRDVTYVNVSDSPSGYTRTVKVTLTDGQGRTSNAVTKPIAVTPVNDPPVLSAMESTALTYVENAAGIPISSSLSVTDPDSDFLSSATITITGNYQKNADLLKFMNTSKIKGSWNALAGTMTLTGTDSVSNYRSAIRSVTFSNQSDTPTTLARTISIQTTDGKAQSNTVSRQIKLTAVEDAPRLAGLETTPLFYQVNAAAIRLTSTLAVTDPDSTQLTGATVQISKFYQKDSDKLRFTNTAKITGTWDAVSGTMRLTGTDTLANYRAAVASVEFYNVSNTPSLVTRTVSFQVIGGTLSSNVVTRNLAVRNAPPVLSSIETSILPYRLTSPAAGITSTIAVTDSDSTVLARAVVRITNVQKGDVLQFTNTATIQGSYNATTGVLTLLGSDTAANYRAALRSVKFVNALSSASKVTRTITFQVHDGLALSNVVSRQISLS